MRLNELNLPQHPIDAQERLRQAGYVQLGIGGMYGSVWSRPGDDYVLKIFKRDDTAYITYLAWCREAKEPWMPRMKSNRVWLLGNAGGMPYCAVRLERLAPLKDAGEPEFSVKRIDAVFFRLAKAEYQHEADMETLAKDVKFQMRARPKEQVEEFRVKRTREIKAKMQQIRAESDELLKSVDPYVLGILSEIREWARKNNFNYDVHRDNAMMRGSQLVITDPVTPALRR
jgi:hypothetical protein